MSRVLGCVLAAAAGCSPRDRDELPLVTPDSYTVTGKDVPLDREAARAQFLAHVGEVRAAMLRMDHERMADLTHRAVAAGMGGRDKFVRRLAGMEAEFRRDDHRFDDIVLGGPVELAEGRGGEVYGVLPYTLRMTRQGVPGVVEAAFVGESLDRGARWAFVDGSGFGGDRAKLRRVMPNFPDALPLPRCPPAVWGRD